MVMLLRTGAGLYNSYYLPRWEKFFSSMRTEITGGDKLDNKMFVKDIMAWEDNWVNLREEKITAIPQGNSVSMAKELWEQYGEILLNHIKH